MRPNPIYRSRAGSSSRGPAAVLAGTVIALLVVHAWREVSSHPPFDAPV